MFNLYYGIPTGTAFTPFIGVGIGESHVSWGDNFRARGPTIYDGTSTHFAYQGIVGIDYALAPKWTFSADYRIKASDDYTFYGSTLGTVITDFNDRNRSIVLSLRYTLD